MYFLITKPPARDIPRPFPIALSLLPDDKPSSVALTEIEDLNNPGGSTYTAYSTALCPDDPIKRPQHPRSFPTPLRRHGRVTCYPAKKPMPTTFGFVRL